MMLEATPFGQDGVFSYCTAAGIRSCHVSGGRRIRWRFYSFSEQIRRVEVKCRDVFYICTEPGAKAPLLSLLLYGTDCRHQHH